MAAERYLDVADELLGRFEPDAEVAYRAARSSPCRLSVPPHLTAPRYLFAMNALTQVFAIISALFHVSAFVMESLLFRRPRVQRLMLGRANVEPGVYLWAFNQGFYNLFVAVGAIGGVIAYHSGQVAAGRALTLYACAFMAAAGVVLLVSDRRLWRGSLGQTAPPLVALVAAAVF